MRQIQVPRVLIQRVTAARVPIAQIVSTHDLVEADESRRLVARANLGIRIERLEAAVVTSSARQCRTERLQIKADKTACLALLVRRQVRRLGERIVLLADLLGADAAEV